MSDLSTQRTLQQVHSGTISLSAAHISLDCADNVIGPASSPG